MVLNDAAEIELLTGQIVTKIKAMKRDMGEPCVTKLEKVQAALGMTAGAGVFGNTPLKDVITPTQGSTYRLLIQKSTVARSGAPLYPKWNSQEQFNSPNSFIGWMKSGSSWNFGIVGKNASKSWDANGRGDQVGGWWNVIYRRSDGAGNPVVALQADMLAQNGVSDVYLSGEDGGDMGLEDAILGDEEWVLSGVMANAQIQRADSNKNSSNNGFIRQATAADPSFDAGMNADPHKVLSNGDRNDQQTFWSFSYQVKQ